MYDMLSLIAMHLDALYALRNVDVLVVTDTYGMMRDSMCSEKLYLP